MHLSVNHCLNAKGTCNLQLYSLSSWIFNLSTDAIDFHAPVKLGHVIHLAGRATFTSSRSMEIEVIVDSKDYVSGRAL